MSHGVGDDEARAIELVEEAMTYPRLLTAWSERFPQHARHSQFVFFQTMLTGMSERLTELRLDLVNAADGERQLLLRQLADCALVAFDSLREAVYDLAHGERHPRPPVDDPVEPELQSMLAVDKSVKWFTAAIANRPGGQEAKA